MLLLLLSLLLSLAGSVLSEIAVAVSVPTFSEPLPPSFMVLPYSLPLVPPSPTLLLLLLLLLPELPPPPLAHLFLAAFAACLAANLASFSANSLASYSFRFFGSGGACGERPNSSLPPLPLLPEPLVWLTRGVAPSLQEASGSKSKVVSFAWGT